MPLELPGAPSTTRIRGQLAIRVNLTNHRTRLADQSSLCPRLPPPPDRRTQKQRERDEREAEKAAFEKRDKPYKEAGLANKRQPPRAQTGLRIDSFLFNMNYTPRYSYPYFPTHPLSHS